MAGGVALVYLDIDDEITSAAARIRVAEEVRVALVVPSGSRLATSRINFRLLAREAQSRSRQLLIVAPDAATRSLAASAGITVYATVRELEEAFAAPAEPQPPAGEAASIPPISPASATGSGSAGAVSELAGLAKPPATARRPPASESEPTRVVPSERLPMATPIRPSDNDMFQRDPYARPAGRGGAPNLPVVGGGDRRRDGGRTAWMIGGAVIVFIALVAGVLGFVFLPAAKIVVTPRVEPISLSFDVRADPTVTASDPANSVVPATVETFPLDATDQFPATGKKITNTKAAGTVTFSNLDQIRSNTIPAGSIVSTTSDVQFVTTNTVHLPPATLAANSQGGFTLVPTTGDSKVMAVKGGIDGNVDADTIKVVPPGENAVALLVTNNAPTTGGTHTETLQIAQKDIDAATAVLTKQLATKLDSVIADPSQVLPGATVFAETKAMTAPAPSVDPTTLVGQLVDTFTYDLGATGSVTAVDETAVQDVATTRLLGSVGADRVLVKDSLHVTVGAGRADGGSIVFPVSAVASQVRTLVAADLVAAVRGKTAAEARTILGTYGDATVDLWPGFSDRIPTYDFRIDLSVHQDTPTESPLPSLPSGSSRPTIRPTPVATRPSAVPSPIHPSEPASPSPSP